MVLFGPLPVGQAFRKAGLGFSATVASTALFLGLCLGLSCGGIDASAREADTASASQVVNLSALPHEAWTTHRLILAGGPFASDRDGVVFGNREHLLPSKPRGYYREYTVPTPGSRDRGARRIVCGGRQPTQPEACFYTDNHYASFHRIAQ